ncbi:MAG TPA: hypothetical protein DCS93_04775 [Microscillaceae bacterium]|nr:hypothetical protein [Microscillaceae bacterium]
MENKILIVDDERMVIMQVSEWLAAQGYQYNFVSKPRLLMKKIEAEAFDLILLDINMPDIDGITLLTQLKNHERYRHIPVIMMTGDANDQTLANCFKYGVEDYVTKPIHELVLMARVNSAITRQRYLKKNLEQQQLLTARLQELEHKETLLVEQKEALEKAVNYITESIDYAQNIQQALLFSANQLQHLLPESFVLLQPLDIVSGDFYWCAEVKQVQDSKTVLAAVDCTGHGVPGAFMSLIANACLDQLIKWQKMVDPAAILTQLHQLILNALRQNETANQDGMEMSICVIDAQTQQLEFAGARSPLVYIQENEVHLVKGDITPIGGSWGEERRSFISHQIPLKTSTTFYLFSDGYLDQFGGKNNKKFLKSQFIEVLQKVHTCPLDEQKTILEKRLQQWMQTGNTFNEPVAQTDDILVIGFRV